MNERDSPRPDQSSADTPTSAGSSDPSLVERPVRSEHTEVIDLNSTQSMPVSSTTPATALEPHPTPVPQQGWFDAFSEGNPTDGPEVPSRADAPWGSDRADALAEVAHRAAYAPPTAPATVSRASSRTPMSAVEARPPAVPSAPGSAAVGPVGGPTGPPVNAPMWSSGTAVSFGPAASPGLDPSQGTGRQFPATPVDRPRRRGSLVALVAAVALVAGMIGGVGGQLLGDRVRPGGSTLPTPGPGSTARPVGSVANIAATALPSVVTIKVDAGSKGSGTGSGFVIDNKGHVLTNNHVVALAAQGGDIQVLLSNGDAEKATVVGRDVSYDLAVLRLNRTDLTPLVLGESDQVVVGDQVIAVGAPLGLDQTVTTGIVSALNRPVTPGTGDETSYMNAIQTDAAINPGNSGGPLLDSGGKVIGVNSAIARVPGMSSSSGGNIGLGFAIPSDQARRTADQLIATGKATHPVIGVSLDRTFSGEGAQVIDAGDAVVANGPAAKAGVKPGDTITGFEGRRVRTPDQLIVSIRARAVGETVTLKVRRDGVDMDLKMTLEASIDK